MEGADSDDQHQSTYAVNQEEEMVEIASSEEPPRSYDCTFCKRGFSNAQALGGHMNIHRKDKAKLKQQAAAAATASSNNTTATTDYHHHHQNQQSSFEVSRIGQSYSPVSIPTTGSFPSSVQVQPSMEGVKAKRAWNILGDEESDHVDATKTNKTSHVAVAEVKQLPLFVKTPLMISGDHEEDHSRRHQNPTGSQVHERVSSSSSSGSLSEVDLELRLGPEPQEPSSATGTKKFF